VTPRSGRSVAAAPLAAPILSPETAQAYLASRGLLGPAEPVVVSELGGGVSNVVLSVSTPAGAMLLKQALPRLRVADEWLAKRERAVTEAAALRLAGSLLPPLVPAVLDVDAGACALTIAHAPASWRPWKELLLAGRAEREVAARLGAALAAWHGGTLGSEDVRERFTDREAFEQLRVGPYYRTVASRHPNAGAAIDGMVELMSSRGTCLVHGDYSPKNVLIGADGMWIIDWEVAHYGDPAFDVAFMLNHLMLKALHRPSSLARFEDCSHVFVGAYERAVPDRLRDDPRYVLAHVGCLMLARVDGKSPVEYLSERGRERARRLGLSLVTEAPADLGAAWRRLSAIFET
jgi:aminoglycoside phosphotransferase (APT) family kinase protein